MSADEFWKDDPQLFVSYRTYFLNKKKREMEEDDYKRWLQGLYIHDGNSKIIASLKMFIGNMFVKNAQNIVIEDYPDKPYIQISKDVSKKEINSKKEKAKKEYENSLVYYSTIKQKYINNLKQKKGE